MSFALWMEIEKSCIVVFSRDVTNRALSCPLFVQTIVAMSVSC